MSELWAKWEGEVINGEFPLRRLVGVSDHSGVFLTEAPAYGLPNAAVKLVPAIPTLAESQLAHWNAAASLSHPRLLRLFASGRCQLPAEPLGQGNQHFLYVLMEYADQNLAQLLETRPLTEIEARETLPPTLDGLAFLHSRNFVQGQLKPSNILVVGEQLKLASDTIRPAGEAATSISMLSVYDPPEGRDGSFSTAGDIWALGVTLYEALTRTTPPRPDERGHGVVLPPDFPPASADVIRECLSRRPADRPTVASLQAWISGKIRYPGVPSSDAAAANSTAAASAGPRAGVSPSGVKSGSDSPASAGRGNASPGGGVSPATQARDATRAGAVSSDAQPSARSPSPAATAAAGATAATAPGRLTIRAVVERDTIEEEPPAPRSYLPWAIAAIAVLAIVLSAVRMLGGHSNTSPPGTNNAPSTNANDTPPQDEPAQVAARPQGAATGSQAAGSQAATGSQAAGSQAAGSRAAGSLAAAGSHPTASVPEPIRPVPAPSKSAPRSQQQPAAPSNSMPRGATASADAGDSVVHEDIPNVPRSALATIHGHVKVIVRVSVDSSGNVVGDSLDRAGPSRYFARIASQSARKWKFAAADGKSNREWLVHFDFSRGGTTAHATGATT